MTLYADDPDVHVTFEVTDSVGQNDINPAVVKAAGYNDIVATWIGDPAPVRKLRIPLTGLPPHKWIRLSLSVPGDNDVEFERVLLSERVAGAAPLPPTAAELLAARITVLETSGGQGSLTVVAGGSVDLDNTKPDGYLIGYKVTAPTTIEGRSFLAGSYIFERDSTVYGGWTVRTIAAGELVTPEPEPDPAPGWTVYDSFTATDGTALNGRTTVKGAKTWVSPHEWEGGGAPEAATITGNLVANTNTGGLATQGGRFNMGGGNVEVEVTYDVSSGADSSANKQVIVNVNSASDSDFLAFQVRAGGNLVCLKGGFVEPVMSGVTTGLPSTGTVNVKLVGNTATVTHPAGVATVTVTPGAAPGWTNTGTFCGVSARSRTAKFDNVKARVPA